eukprot:4244189-Prymnesium_polylepis.2
MPKRVHDDGLKQTSLRAFFGQPSAEPKSKQRKMDSFLAKGPAAQPPGFETESEVSDAASEHALSRESMPDIQAAAPPSS